jgi:hypothetical protein
MGACKSKDKKSHHAHEKSDVIKADVKATIVNPVVNGVQENPTVVKAVPHKEIISPEPAIQKVPQYKIKFVVGGRVIHEGVFPGDQPLSAVSNELRVKLNGSEYDYLLVNSANNSKQDITRRGNDTLKTILPEEMNVIELSYAGLDISPNIRKAYADMTGIVATPKYDASSFEVISFNKSTNGVAYQIYQDESFNYLKTLNEFSAYCNGNNKFYISGSDKKNEDETYNNLFIEIDLNNLNKPDHLRKLPNLLTGRGWHSMIFVPPRNVFIVGGINTKSVELFNVEKNQITHDSNLNENRSEASLCCVNNSYLYAFCGFLLNNNFIPTIERCNLKARTRQWEIVNIISDQTCNFEPSFFSVAYGKGNSIILLGGNENQRSSAKNYVFELKDGNDTIANYQVNPVDDFYLCSEKFFLPINEKASILMPVYTSEVVKVLIFDSEASNLSLIKFEVLETADEDVRNSLNFQYNDKSADNNPLQRFHEEKIKPGM